MGRVACDRDKCGKRAADQLQPDHIPSARSLLPGA
jgi:hypothetical protein